uniref:Uncharacterized protein n=1 Tax=Glossina palpalis gambiensis TaxID=67801 RepID=A0A1B0B409_9MUSC
MKCERVPAWLPRIAINYRMPQRPSDLIRPQQYFLEVFIVTDKSLRSESYSTFSSDAEFEQDFFCKNIFGFSHYFENSNSSVTKSTAAHQQTNEMTQYFEKDYW